MREAKQSLIWMFVSLSLLYVFLWYTNSIVLWGSDFPSYYVASNELTHAGNPYSTPIRMNQSWSMWAEYALPNPNPPIVLWLFSFFSQFSFSLAFILWAVFTTILSCVGVVQTIKCLCPTAYSRSEHWYVLLFYFCLFPIAMNSLILQVGGILLFLLIMGYTNYLKKRDFYAAWWWGWLIAIKLFPVLLILYTLLKKRYTLTAWLCIWVTIWTSLPLLFLDWHQYQQYFTAITSFISWYGLNWNMSFMGFSYRILTQPQAPVTVSIHSVFGGKALFTIVAKNVALCVNLAILITWIALFHRFDQREENHQGFSCALILMLLLSPLACVYYLPILLIPLLCTLNDAIHRSASTPLRLVIWFASLFCLCFPILATLPERMPTFLSKLGIYSIHFYGLLGLAYLTCTMRQAVRSFTMQALPVSIKRSLKGLALFGFGVIILRAGLIWFRALFG